MVLPAGVFNHRGIDAVVACFIPQKALQINHVLNPNPLVPSWALKRFPIN
jgi:hypothetical protein